MTLGMHNLDPFTRHLLFCLSSPKTSATHTFTMILRSTNTRGRKDPLSFPHNLLRMVSQVGDALSWDRLKFTPVACKLFESLVYRIRKERCQWVHNYEAPQWLNLFRLFSVSTPFHLFIPLVTCCAAAKDFMLTFCVAAAELSATFVVHAFTQFNVALGFQADPVPADAKA